MKTLKVKSILFSLLAIMAVAVFMTSCEQEAIQVGNLSEHTGISLKDIRVENEDGILKFEGGEHFFAEFDYLNNATTEELIAFTQELGFESYLSAITDAYAQLETISAPDEFETFKQTYSHLFIFENDRLVERIENLAYAAITNIDGMVLIGDYAIKVESDRIIEELNGDLEKLRKINALSDINTQPNFNVLAYEDMSKNQCPNPSTAYASTSKRRVIFDIKVFPASCGCGNYRVYYTVRARGYKKTFGSWWSYRTLLEFECVDFVVKINGVSYSISGLSKKQDNVKELSLSSEIGPNYDSYPSVQLDKVRGRASSRGVDSRWAVICCDYGNSCPSNTGSPGNCY